MPNNNQQHCMTFKINKDGSHNAAEIADFVKAESWDVNGDKLTLFNLVLVGKAQFTAMNGEDIFISGLNSEQQIEQEIQAKGLNAPRLTPDHIDSKIKAVEYILPREVCKRDNGVEVFDAPLPLQTLTFCILTLENGFTVTGESACASPENYDAEIGKEIAYTNAREKIWVLEGYLLKQHLYNYSIVPSESNIKAELQVNCDNGSEPTPELPKLNNCDAVKPSEPTNDNQGNAYLLTQLLNTPNISSVLHKKAEAKMMALLDQLF